MVPGRGSTHCAGSGHTTGGDGSSSDQEAAVALIQRHDNLRGKRRKAERSRRRTRGNDAESRGALHGRQQTGARSILPDRSGGDRLGRGNRSRRTATRRRAGAARAGGGFAGCRARRESTRHAEQQQAEQQGEREFHGWAAAAVRVSGPRTDYFLAFFSSASIFLTNLAGDLSKSFLHDLQHSLISRSP